jgi:hypothetical protein
MFTTLKQGIQLWFESSWVKKYLTDGWITQGPQIATPPNLLRMFICCYACRRTMPAWSVMMTAEESRKRGYLGCRCGSMQVRPARLRCFNSFYWFAIRGWLIRKIILKKQYNWDPRIVGLEKDLG